jgi:putative endonuclease
MHRRDDLRGSAFERRAESYLLEHGLELVARNHRCRDGEIDLVMRDRAQLVFVEVRYRRHLRFGGARESITRRKQQRIITAAQDFLALHHDLADLPCRFDVVAMHGSLDAPDCDWISAAFSA